MGQFSWIAVDTKESIKNDLAAGSQTVTMVYLDAEGKECRVTETDYEGYGEFGGVDYYEAIVWMNPWYNPYVTNKELRDKGIDIYFGEVPNTKYPQLFLGTPPEVVDFTQKVLSDPNQGWSVEEDWGDDGEDWEDDGEEDAYYREQGLIQ